MIPALFDSSILIDVLSGVPAAEAEVAAYPDRAISLVTWIEVLVGATPAQESDTRTLLALFHRLSISPEIAERTVMVRRQRRLKFPDAVLYATAQVTGRIFITRNSRDFPASDPAVRIPYLL